MGGNIIPLDEIPDSYIIPENTYLVQVEMESSLTKKTGYKMLVAHHTVLEPKEYEGAQVTDWFVLGNEADPDGQDPASYKRAVRFKRFTKACGVPSVSMSEDDLIAHLDGQQCVVTVSLVPEGPDSEGVMRQAQNRVGGYYLPGEREVNEAGQARSISTPARAAAPSRPVATAAPARAPVAAPRAAAQVARPVAAATRASAPAPRRAAMQSRDEE